MDLQHDLEADQDSGLSTTGGAVPGTIAARAEKLLTLCARAIENRNAPIAQRAVCALQKISSVDGEPRERVTAYFLNALVTRAGSLLHDLQLRPPVDQSAHVHKNQAPKVQWADRRLGFNQLSQLVDMTPFYRFGYMVANGAILDAFEGMHHVHIVDFSTSHCMQWPTLIDSLADRMDVTAPTTVRLTVSTPSLPTPPQLQPTYEEVGHRLASWAKKKGVPFEFKILPKPLESLQISDIDLRNSESLAVNCSLRLHYLPDETTVTEAGSPSPRENLLHLIRCLNPNVVTLFEEDCDATSTDLVERVTNSYDHEWIAFDYLATYSSPNWHDRLHHEHEVGRKIENIIACEGESRLERLESKAQWCARMDRVGFRAQSISDEVVAAVRQMVGDYAVGWGMKVDDDDALTLSWKGHSLAFASAWAPAAASPAWV